MQDTEVYIKTDAGRDEIKSRALGLPMPVRAILLMVDGQRSVSAMRSLIAGSKAPANVLDALFEQGLIEPRSGVASAPVALVGPSFATIAVVEAVMPEVGESVAVARPAAPPPAIVLAPAETAIRQEASYDVPLDLVLPTIYGPASIAPVAVRPTVEPAVAPLAAAKATPAINRYEQLYMMMNEIVRDFLAPHRRYFLQLKIERCGTPEELLELLHDLQTALAKSRGEAFASDVIARLRNAAA